MCNDSSYQCYSRIGVMNVVKKLCTSEVFMKWDVVISSSINNKKFSFRNILKIPDFKGVKMLIYIYIYTSNKAKV